MTRQELQDFITYTLLFGFMVALIALVIGVPIYLLEQAKADQAYLQMIYEGIN